MVGARGRRLEGGSDGHYVWVVPIDPRHCISKASFSASWLGLASLQLPLAPHPHNISSCGGFIEILSLVFLMAAIPPRSQGCSFCGRLDCGLSFGGDTGTAPF